ncbi:hypothetical protein HPB50_019166 [Hyalomma asiaticum]|uniref:Uncharacterized protein n=1 Tax=Hyalomma asiaticum TaxID=266040 RepID=A0ACB7T692_HYAAI|nr:hypothetical protein HPB50_019166 [Hyalomma asiaticum]
MRKVDGTKQDFKRQVKDILYTDVSNFFVLGSGDTMNRALELENYVPACSECDNVAFIMATPEPANLHLLAEAKKEKHFNDQTEQLDAAFYADVTRMIIRAAKEERASGRLPPGLEYPTCTKMDLTSSMSAARSNITLNKALMRKRYAGPFGPIVIREEENGYQEMRMSVKRVNVPSKGENMTFTTVANWKHKEPEGVLVENPGADLKKYAAVTLFRVTTVVHPPFVIKKNNSDGEDQFEGYCIDLMDEIKKMLKFEYTIYEVPDKMFGSLEGNTTQWNGMVRQLLDNNADIALGPLSVTAERETVVDYTMPFYDMVGISILMKKPASKSSLFKFLTVLEGSVWGCILAAYFFTSLLMYLFDRYSPYSYRNNKEKYKDDEDKRDFSLKESLWFCMTSLTPQGGGEAPRNLSGRLVAATWWLFGFIIIASYTANLAAFLTVSRLDTPIESLDDLAKQYKVKYAPQNGTAAMTYFKRMADIEDKFYDVWKNMSLDDTLSDEDRAKLAVWDYPVSDKYTKMWQTMVQTQIPAHFEEGLRRVKESNGSQEGFAFLADATLVRYAIMTDCELTSVGSEFSRMPLALAVQKNSPLKDQLSSAILKLHNDGRLDDLKEMWWNKNPARANCDDSDGQSDAISIRNIGGVFIVIGIGVVMALIALAIEYCYFKIRMRKAKVIAVKSFSGKGSAKEPIKH